MKKTFALAWLGVLAVIVWCDRRWAPLLRAHTAAAAQFAAGTRAEQTEDWNAAIVAYAGAISALPDDTAHRTARLRAELAMNGAIARTGRRLEAVKAMDDMLLRSSGDPLVAPEVVHDIRRRLGALHYYNAWTMRLRNAPTGSWTGEAELSRQQFRYLAETAVSDMVSESDARNAERVVRLERLNLSELRGLPLPKEGQGHDTVESDKLADEPKVDPNAKPPKKPPSAPPKNDEGRPGAAGLPNEFRGFKGS